MVSCDSSRLEIRPSFPFSALLLCTYLIIYEYLRLLVFSLFYDQKSSHFDIFWDRYLFAPFCINRHFQLNKNSRAGFFSFHHINNVTNRPFLSTKMTFRVKLVHIDSYYIMDALPRGDRGAVRRLPHTRPSVSECLFVCLCARGGTAGIRGRITVVYCHRFLCGPINRLHLIYGAILITSHADRRRKRRRCRCVFSPTYFYFFWR